ncbi:MAG: hypothetical protein PVF49_09500 [Anaerolineales bacterium]|jgi:hypothetical protein
MKPHSIAGVNALPEDEKRALYARFIPEQLLDMFNIKQDFFDEQGRSLLKLRARPGSTNVILDLRHTWDALDPLLYAHLTDTMNGQIHVLLYIVNDPASPRFDVDRMPDGTPTEFGTALRNLAAEEAAMKAGLAPGQVRSGLRILKHSIQHFEDFVTSLGHDIYFIEPLYYHNAIIFEGYGFAYQQGRRMMERIQAGFMEGGELQQKLDGSTPFRQPSASSSIRGRSWAIHDGILGEHYANVTMYKEVNRHAGVQTFPDASW